MLLSPLKRYAVNLYYTVILKKSNMHFLVNYPTVNKVLCMCHIYFIVNIWVLVFV